MRAIAVLTVSLTKEYLRNREALFFALLFPVILLVIFSAVFAGGSTEFTLYVQNNDLAADGEPTNLSVAYVDSLEAAGAVNVQSVKAGRSLTDWSEEERSTDTQRVLVIPDGFDEQVRDRSRRVRLQVIRDTLDRAGGGIDPGQRAAIERNLSQAEPEGSDEGPVVLQLRSPPDDGAADAVLSILRSHVATFNDRSIGVDQPTATVESADLDATDLTAVDYFLPAFIAAIVMFNGVVSVTQYVSEFTQRGTLKRLVATPLRKRDWIIANLIQQTLLALVLTFVLVAVAALVYGVTAVPGPLAIALVVVGAIAFSSIGITLGSTIRDSSAAVSLGLAIALPLMFLSGVFWEVDLMPATIQQVAGFMPLLYFHRGLRQLMIVGTTDGIVLPFAVLGGMAIVFVALAVRTTRWQDFG